MIFKLHRYFHTWYRCFDHRRLRFGLWCRCFDTYFYMLSLYTCTCINVSIFGGLDNWYCIPWPVYVVHTTWPSRRVGSGALTSVACHTLGTAARSSCMRLHTYARMYGIMWLPQGISCDCIAQLCSRLDLFLSSGYQELGTTIYGRISGLHTM